jgi:hypothetical protein
MKYLYLILIITNLFSCTKNTPAYKRVKVNDVTQTNIPELEGFFLIKDKGSIITLSNNKKILKYKYTDREFKKTLITEVFPNKNKNLIIHKFHMYKLENHRFVQILREKEVKNNIDRFHASE